MKAACYVRVSSEEQVQGHSLDAQERALREHCRQKGWEVSAWYRDEGKSARSDDLHRRPAFARMLADAEAGRIDVVVVHKLDRFARNLRVTLEVLDRLERCRVGFASVHQQMDFTTPTGRVLLASLGGFAQFYSDNLSWETKKGKGERKRKGLYNGALPFGVAKGPDGVPVPDAEPRWCDVATRQEVSPADGLRLAFELAAEGRTDREIAATLTEAGHRTSGTRGRNPLTKDTVRVILRNRFYLGQLPDGAGGSVAGRHGALVDPTLFERAQAARTANMKPQWTRSAARSPWALSGVATCGRCGKPVVADGRRRVCCAGRSQGNGCTEPSYDAAVVERQIGAYLAGFAVPEEKRERFLTAWRRSQSRQVDTVAKRRALERQRDRLKELYLAGDVEREEYRARKATIAEELASLPADGNPDADAGRLLAGFLADVSAAWEVATPDERNRLARQLFGQVVIANRTAVAIVPRPDLRPFFESLGPSDEDLRNRRKRRASLSRTHHVDGVRLGRSAADEAHGRRFRTGAVFACPSAGTGDRRAGRHPRPRPHQEPTLPGRRLRRQPRDRAARAPGGGAGRRLRREAPWAPPPGCPP